jgi:hypothetical protein
MAEPEDLKFSLGSSGEAASGSTLYCNNAQILTSSWDFNFEFSQLVPIPSEREGEPPVVSKNAVQRIVMSPQHAKAFSNILKQNVEQWEQQFGELSPLSQNPPETEERESP